MGDGGVLGGEQAGVFGVEPGPRRRGVGQRVGVGAGGGRVEPDGHTKKIGILVAFVLAAFLGSSGTAVSADPVGAAAGCRAAPYSATFNLYFETESYADLGNYRTSTQCDDINARSTNGTGYHACVIFVRHTSECDYRTFLPANGQWVNIATDVLDNTVFNVRVFKGGANYVSRAGVMDF